MRLEGMKITREGDKKPSDLLNEIVLEEAKKVKLIVPFKADGFKAEKQPTQPDGVTLMVVEPANIGSNIEIQKEEPKVMPKELPKVEPKIEPKVTKVTKTIKKTKKGGK